jgi:hypothetical protein
MLSTKFETWPLTNACDGDDNEDHDDGDYCHGNKQHCVAISE